MPPPPRHTAENSIQRTIQFWRTYEELNDKGIMRRIDGARICADILAISRTPARYLTDRNGIDLRVRPREASDPPGSTASVCAIRVARPTDSRVSNHNEFTSRARSAERAGYIRFQ
jgi:hypothetical protein